MNHLKILEESILTLRREFDESFQRAPVLADANTSSYLVLRVSSVRYAVALRQVASLQSRARITPLPSAHPALLGVCGARRELLAVYDLAVCLGHPKVEEHPWLLRVTGTTLAFAFEHFDRHARSRDATHDANTARVVTLDDVGSVPLLDLNQLARGVIGSSRPAAATAKEP